MKKIRAFLRVFFLFLSMVTCAVPLYLSHAVRWLNDDLGLSLRSFVTRRWAKIAMWILGVRITVKGTPPKPPFMLVSNHLSYIDIILLFSQIDCVFVAKKELASWPFIGMLITASGTIFVNRESRRDIPRVNALIAKNINKHHGLILFPEGTSTRGVEVMPFKPGLLQYPASQQQEVSVASIHYQTAPGDVPADISVCFWGDMAFPGHVPGLLQLSRIYATVSFGQETVLDSDRKTLAQKSWQLVNELFVPVVTLEKEHDLSAELDF